MVFKRGKPLGSVLLKLKLKEPRDKSENNVYCKVCKTCNMIYIGESGQYQSERDKQHQSDVRRKILTNAIFKHLEQFPNHEIAWDEMFSLDRDGDYKKRKIKEAVFIKALEGDVLINLEGGAQISSVWEELGPQIRKCADAVIGKFLR